MSEFLLGGVWKNYRESERDAWKPMPKGMEFYTRNGIIRMTRFSEDMVKQCLRPEYNGHEELLIHPFQVKIAHQIMNGYSRDGLETFLKIKMILLQEIIPLVDAEYLLRDKNLSFTEILARSKAQGVIFLGSSLPDGAIDRENLVGFQ